MNVFLSYAKLVRIPAPMVYISGLPYNQSWAKLVGKTAFDHPDCTLQRHSEWSDQKMHMIRHHHERMQLIETTTTVPLQDVEE